MPIEVVPGKPGARRWSRRRAAGRTHAAEAACDAGARPPRRSRCRCPAAGAARAARASRRAPARGTARHVRELVASVGRALVISGCRRAPGYAERPGEARPGTSDVLGVELVDRGLPRARAARSRCRCAGCRARSPRRPGRWRPGPTGRRGRSSPPGRRAPRALTTSLPRRMPPSSSTSTWSPTASAIGGSARIGAGVPSRLLPPWLDTEIAVTPASTARCASSTRHDALEHERPAPLLAQPGDVVPGRRRRLHPLAVGAEERRRRLRRAAPGWGRSGRAAAPVLANSSSQRGRRSTSGANRSIALRSIFSGIAGLPQSRPWRTTSPG